MDTTNEDKELESLRTAVISGLQSDGVFNELRAQLRAHVFRVCDNTYHQSRCRKLKTEPNAQNLLINQLIGEYLRFNGYKQSLNIFNCETGEQNDTNLDRLLVEKRLGLHSTQEESNQLPLLNTIIDQIFTQSETTNKTYH